jgi:hypothetical protein
MHVDLQQYIIMREPKMKFARMLGMILLLVSPPTFAQAPNGANRQYRGYQQTAPSSVTTTYNQQGQD